MNNASQQKAVLCVDDEVNILNTLRRFFRPFKCKVFTAESGVEGLSILENNHVDLVISDMQMPRMNGAEFLRRVAEEKPGIPRIMLTGYADEAIVKQAIADKYISKLLAKPWCDEELRATVKPYLEN